MSRSLSATGWSAGGTLLAALVGSLAGSVAGAAVAAAGGGAVVVAVSFLLVSSLLASALLVSAAGGAVTTSAGLVSGAVSVVFGSGVVGSGVFGASILATSGTDAVESSLKSLMVGGGTFAGSGRGIAASIASSAALLRAGSPCARAEVADTVRKVATAISTRSNPARFFEQSRI